MAINWYSHHLGDYEKKTKHLTILEHGAYRLLLDHFYSNGGPFPDDRKNIYRAVRANTTHERRTIDKILIEFFVMGDDGLWFQERASQEISKYNEISDIKKKAAYKRWSGADAHASPHAMPPTPTPTPTVKDKPPKPPFDAKTLPVPIDIPKQDWDNFVDHRKEIKKPLTRKAAEICFVQLLAFHRKGHNPAEVINNSIMNGWQGLFEPMIRQSNGRVKETYSDMVIGAMKGAIKNINPKERDDGIP